MYLLKNKYNKRVSASINKELSCVIKSFFQNILKNTSKRTLLKIFWTNSTWRYELNQKKKKISKLLLKEYIIKISVVTDWHVDAVHMEFAMMLSTLKMNLVGTSGKNSQCTVCKSLHPKITGKKGQAIIIVLYPEWHFYKFLKNMNFMNFLRKKINLQLPLHQKLPASLDLGMAPCRKLKQF